MRDIYGKFRVVEALPRGPLGQVYHVEDTFLQLPRRLKSPHEAWGQGSYAERLQHSLHRLQARAPQVGPYVQVPVHMFVADDRLYVVDPWRPYLAPPRLEPSLAVPWVWHFGWALVRLHDAGFVHGGLGLSNVGQDADGLLYLLDPGWRTVACTEVKPSPCPALARDPSWPPEARRGLPLTPKADVYGLAYVLYHWLTGQPYSGVLPEHPALQPWYEVLQPGLAAEPAQRPDLPAWLQALERVAARHSIALPRPPASPEARAPAAAPPRETAPVREDRAAGIASASGPAAPTEGDETAPASAGAALPKAAPEDEARAAAAKVAPDTTATSPAAAGDEPAAEGPVSRAAAPEDEARAAAADTPATPEAVPQEDEDDAPLEPSADSAPSLPPEAVEAGLLAWQAEPWEQWMTTHAPDAGLTRAARWLVYIMFVVAVLTLVWAGVVLFVMAP